MDNQNQVLKIVEQSFHISLGAISVATETLQNEQKRAQLVSEISEELNQRAQEWEEKGEATATEARRFIEELINQDSSGESAGSSDSARETGSASSSEETAPSPTDFPSRLQSLTDEVTTLREEIAKFRQSA